MTNASNTAETCMARPAALPALLAPQSRMARILTALVPGARRRRAMAELAAMELRLAAINAADEARKVRDRERRIAARRARAAALAADPTAPARVRTVDVLGAADAAIVAELAERTRAMFRAELAARAAEGDAFAAMALSVH